MRPLRALGFITLLSAMAGGSFFFGSVSPGYHMGLITLIFLALVFYPPDPQPFLRLPSLFRYGACLVLFWIMLQSALWAVDRNQAWMQTLFWVACAGLFLQIQRFTAAQISVIVKALVYAALFQALLGFWQLAQRPEAVLWQIKTSHLGYLTGSYINRNHCAGMLEVGLGCCLGLCLHFLDQNKPKSMFMGFIFFSILAMALFATGSRFGILSFGITLAAGVLWAWINRPCWRKVCCAGGAIVVSAALLLGSRLISRFRLEEGFMQPISGRLWAWQDVLHLINGWNGLRGVGLGGFDLAFAQVQSARLLMGWAHAHQDYLELAAVLGVPMAALWLAGWGSLLSVSIRKSLSKGGESGLALGLGIGIVSLALHGLMDFNFAIPANVMIWVVAVACLVKISNPQDASSTSAVIIPLRVLAVILGVLSFFFAVSGFETMKAEVYLKSGSYQAAASAARRALKRVPDSAQALSILGQSEWNEFKRSGRSESLVASKAAWVQLTQKYPTHAKGWYSRGVVEKNLAFLNKALELEPHSPWMRIYTALESLTFLTHQDSSQSRPLLKRIRRALKQHYAYQSSPYLDDVYERLGQLGYGPDVLAYVTPREARSYFQLLEYLKKHSDWENYSRFEPRYWAFSRSLSIRLCDEADGWLESGRLKRASAAYQFAKDQYPLGARAQAGILASALLQGQKLSYAQILRGLLFQEEEDLSFYWPLIEPYTRKLAADLRAMVAYRMGRFDEAIELFGLLKDKSLSETKRYLAQALIERERLEEAWRVLEPALRNSEADLRELLLLQRLADNSKSRLAQVDKAVRSAQELNLSWISSTQRAKNTLSWGERSGLQLNLMPGPVEIKVLLKGESEDSKVMLTRLSLWEKDRELFRGSAAARSHWQKAIWRLESTGGWRWLQLELEAKSKTDETERLILGTVELNYPE